MGTSTGGGPSLKKSPGSTTHGQEIPNLVAPKQDQLRNSRGPMQMKMWDRSMWKGGLESSANQKVSSVGGCVHYTVDDRRTGEG